MIKLNDNIKLKAGKPLDSKYLSSGNTAYSTASVVNTQIPISERYVGLTVLVNNVEYWYKNGVANSNLVEKNPSLTNYISGATNLGYFSGKDGIQILPMNHSTDSSFNGDYVCLYNNYYRGSDGVIHIGTPSDGINKRAYVKTTGTVRSWIWNERVAGSDLLGWIFIDGDVSEMVGTFQYSSTPNYYNTTTTFPYINTFWTNGIAYNNSSNLVINTVEGSLTTGNTITIGVRPYSLTEDKVLKFKSFVSETPDYLQFTEDEAFIHVTANLTGKTDQTNFISHTGDTSIHYPMSGITGFTNASDFTGLTETVSGHTGDTSIHYPMSGISISEKQLTKSHRQISGTTIITITDYVIECIDGTFSVVLPTAVGNEDVEFYIKNTGTGTITLDGDGSETIDGSLTKTINQWECIHVKSNGNNWIIL